MLLRDFEIYGVIFMTVCLLLENLSSILTDTFLVNYKEPVPKLTKSNHTLLTD